MNLTNFAKYLNNNLDITGTVRFKPCEEKIIRFKDNTKLMLTPFQKDGLVLVYRELFKIPNDVDKCAKFYKEILTYQYLGYETADHILSLAPDTGSVLMHKNLTLFDALEPHEAYEEFVEEIFFFLSMSKDAIEALEKHIL